MRRLASLGILVGLARGRKKQERLQRPPPPPPEEKVDALAFTLDKSGGSFSPTTRYRDYAISREVIHWESQSTTRSTSETGRRYQSHDASGCLPLLFARMSPDDRSFWFLGPASYISHEGDRPMAIQWRLSHPLPGDLFAKFAVAIC